MVLVKVNLECIASFKLECDAPRAIDVNRVAHGLSGQLVEIVACQLQFGTVDGFVERIETNSYSATIRMRARCACAFSCRRSRFAASGAAILPKITTDRQALATTNPGSCDRGVRRICIPVSFFRCLG